MIDPFIQRGKQIRMKNLNRFLGYAFQHIYYFSKICSSSNNPNDRNQEFICSQPRSILGVYEILRACVRIIGLFIGVPTLSAPD
jgi:hypothetical protein